MHDAYGTEIKLGDIVACKTGLDALALGVVLNLNKIIPTVTVVRKWTNIGLVTDRSVVNAQKIIVLGMIPPATPADVVQKLYEERAKVLNDA